MTWTEFYLVCFLVGFGLSAIALFAGSAHLHIPHLHFHHGLHIPQTHAGGAHGPHATELSWFNFGTIAAFLAWFGGTGYLLERYYSVWFVVALIVSILSGIGAASVVFLFLAKVLMAKEAALNPLDYDMVGVLGKLSLPIRQGGTGEMIYSQEGTRRVTGARSEDGAAIPKGAEVMVTRYEKGIAYVRPWEDPTAE
jgi:membrane protein implicated in regulation of membrane protease activity